MSDTTPGTSAQHRPAPRQVDLSSLVGDRARSGSSAPDAASVAGVTALGVSGVHSLGTPAGRAVSAAGRVLLRDSGVAGVRVDDGDPRRLVVEVTVVVAYPSPVRHVADQVRDQVRDALAQLDGAEVTVDVVVADVHAPDDDEPSEAAEAASQPPDEERAEG